MTPLDKPKRSVARVTLGALGYGHGADRNRKLVARLAYGDLLELRPHGTRRAVTLNLVDVYSYALRCKANVARLERAREIKARNDRKRAEARLRREARRAIKEGS